MKNENPLFEITLIGVYNLIINLNVILKKHTEDSKLKYAIETYIAPQANELYKPVNEDYQKEFKDIEKLTNKLKLDFAAEQRARPGDEDSPMVLIKNPDSSFVYTKEGQKNLDEALERGIEKIKADGVKRRERLFATKVKIEPYYVEDIEKYNLHESFIEGLTGILIKPADDPKKSNLKKSA